MPRDMTGRISDEARLALENVTDFARDLAVPTLRLGVTGLARAGKTVFITALVHHLLAASRLPGFTPMREGRYRGAQLVPQGDDAVPTFDYRSHIRLLTEERLWPHSTRSISEMRLTISYDRASLLGHWLDLGLGPGRLNLDIVDYPGEWLLDLPLMVRDYRTWSEEALTRARNAGQTGISGELLEVLKEADPVAGQDEATAARLADAFKRYLAAARADDLAFSVTPPGRFLMPGDLEGSPALTFAPLILPAETSAPSGSLWAMMERRYDSYKQKVVRPFFQDHFSRLDRQIVLVDVLHALNAGPAAVQDLETAMVDILACFKVGSGGFLSQLFSRKVDRLLFAATKADHLHHLSHDRLERILGRLTEKAIERARFSGAKVDVRAIAAVRATREAQVRERGEILSCIAGIPQAGENLGNQVYDGNREVALFPGELPERADSLFADEAEKPDLRFLRFRPPLRDIAANGQQLALPHIRLDRALDFLIGDRFQ